jgi:hypothetical protein
MKITLNKSSSHKVKVHLLRDNQWEVKGAKRSIKKVMMNMKAQASRKGELSNKS